MENKEFELLFCKNIRSRCAAQGLPLRELSVKSGVPLSLLQQMEQNTLSEEFLVEYIFDLARALGCRASELCQ